MANQDDPRYRYNSNRDAMEACDDITDAEKTALLKMEDSGRITP